MSCVNRSSQEFKDCCNRLNVSASTLEPIVHEFINTGGNESSFPSDVYIEDRINGREMPVLSEDQITLWEKRFSEPMQFDDALEAMSYAVEAERFFPRESIGIKETTNHKFEVNVRKPILVGPTFDFGASVEEIERQLKEYKEANNIFNNKTLASKYNKLLKYVRENFGTKGFSLRKFNADWKTNFGYNPNTGEITTKDPRINGVSILNTNDTEIKAKKKIDRALLLEYLSTKFGLKIKEISNDEYRRKAGDFSNCCVIGDTVYIRKGDINKLTNEQLIEEFLHPMVNALYKANPEVISKLLDEARRLFPDLDKQIKEAYKTQGIQVQEEELITQVLSKYLNREISDKGTNTKTIANYIKQVFEYILDLLKDLFGDIRIEKNTRLKISGKDIKDVFSFQNFAELINSKEISFTDILSNNEVRNNLNKPSEIVLTDEQQKVVQNVSDFIETRFKGGRTKTNFITISGMAGTGKTTIVKSILDEIDDRGVWGSIAVAAVSRKAVKVLSEKLSSSSITVAAESVYTLAGANPNASEDKFAIDPDKEKISKYKIIFIDEASMVEEHMFNTLNNYLKSHSRTTVVLLGDYGQIRPIPKVGSQSKKSLAFNPETSQIETLTERIRQGEGSPILGYADEYYEISTKNPDKKVSTITNSTEGKTKITDKGALVFHRYSAQKLFPKIVEVFREALNKGNQNYAKIVAATHKRLNELNRDIHNALFPNHPNELCEGDAVMFNSPFKVDPYTTLENATEGFITKVGERTTDDYGIECIHYTIKVGNYSYVVKKKVDSQNNNDKYNRILNELKSKALASRTKIAWRDYYAFQEQYADFDMAYAITAHKAQGSTYDIVFVDETDIHNAGAWGNQERAEITYTALTRSRNISVVMSNDGSGENVDSFVFLNEEIENNKNPQAISDATTEEDIETDSYDKIFDSEQLTQEENSSLLEEYQQNTEFYSGGADGADLAWDKYLTEKGLKVKHFTVRDYDALPQSEKDRIEEIYQGVVQFLGRRPYDANDYRGKLVRRDALQAEAADAVFAIGEFNDKGQVSGGTAYAVTIASSDKPVYFYDLKTHKWYFYEYQAGAFLPYEGIPTLTKHAAVIGTRDQKGIKGAEALRQEGHEAIKAVIEKTFGENIEQQSDETTENDSEEKFLEYQEKVEKAVNEAQKFIESNNAFSEQVEALINSNIVNQSEVTELANDVAYYISDMITQWQEEPHKFFENFPSKRREGKTLKEDIEWFNSLSRKQIIESVSLGKFLEVVKENLFGDVNTEGLSDEEASLLEDKTMLFYENFDALLRFGMSAFRSVEDFNINYSESGFKVDDIKSEQNTSDGTEFSNEELDFIEELGDKQEHWQIDSRTIDNFLSMSQIVKRELVRCYLKTTDKNDEVINEVNAYGVNKRVDPKNATSSILRWTQGSLTLEDMITKLKDKQQANPWLEQLITKLEDKSGKYTDLQGQFFSVFCKHFQEYYMVLEQHTKDGKVLKTIPLNVNPALKDIMSTIEVSFKLFKHPLFTQNGVNEKKFNQLIKAYNRLVELTQQPFESLNIEQISTGIAYISDILGYNITPEDASWGINNESLPTMLRAVSSIIDNLRKEASNPNYNPFSFKKSDNGISGYMRVFLTPLVDRLEDIAISSFYDSGKMYQSYVTPSYLTKLMRKFRDLDSKEFKAFLKEEYGDYEWFRDTSMRIDNNTSWKNIWLRELSKMTPEERKKKFGHKVLLNYNGHNYMRNMTSPEYVLAILTEFFSGLTTDKETTTTAWYKIPMMSNKPSFEFIKFLRYKGSNYQDILTTNLVSVFMQELARIQTVIARSFSKSDPQFIKNFDSNGKKFMFLEYLNPYLAHLNGSLKDTELGILLNNKINGVVSDDLEQRKKDEVRLRELVEEVIKTEMNAKADALIQKYKDNGIFAIAKTIDGIGKTDADVENSLRNFFWNDTFASINILQLTITDTAYYANAEDVQKRLAQIHAPGMRGNTEAVDYDGNPVSDGTLRTIFLKDFDKYVSNIIENLEIVFDRRIAQAKTDSEKEYWKSTKESIIEQFKDINVADAQAYNCPTSYRKKAFMFGKWSKKAEEIYQKLVSGEYNISDLETAFQPLKPFVYTNTTKMVGVEGTPMKKLKVNMQFKNSEYLLIMADAILQGEDTGKPNLLRALFQVMEESAKKYPTQGIDTVQFESAVKVGLQATLDLRPCLNMKNGESVAKEMIEAAIYDNERGYYNTTYVHEYPAEDYTIQQEVPKHFMNHEQGQGSQERMIIPSDLARVDSNGNEVRYTFVDNGETKSLTAEEFRDEYEKTISENIENSLNALTAELGLDIADKRVRNVALSKILQKEILSSPRYGMDLYIACSVDKDGNFNIPLGDPIQSKRIEQLINSIIKNRVNKQKIAGGPVVQVTNFGTSTQLHIKFKDRNGNILLTLDEWLALEENKGKSVDDYKEYLKENQAGVAYYECYAPAYMQELLEDFMGEHGNIDIEAIEATNPELLDMIGYRIPSEDLYSIAPLRIKGFLPKEAGEGIMLPYEITLITGSDFDIDKFYLMRKEFIIKRRKTKEIKELLVQKLGKKRREEIQMFLDQVQDNKYTAFGTYPDIAKEYRKCAYIAEKPTKGRAYRNNKVIDMSLAVLTHETSTERLLNPGGFEPQKRMGCLITAYKNGSGSWEELSKLSTYELKDICMYEKNLSYIDVNTQFYEQNNAAGSILGMFAVQKIAHAVLEGNKLYLDVSSVLGLPEGKVFGIAGKKFYGKMEFDGTVNFRGEYIGKILGSLVASAADAVKDPVLNLMNINSTTANVLTTLIRMGIPFETASILLSQDVVSECLREFNTENLSSFISFREVLDRKLNAIREEAGGIDKDNDINYENLSKAEMVQGLKPNAPVNVRYKALLTFIRALDLSTELKGPTYATRFNSISNAVGPMILHNIIMKHKLNAFSNHIFVEQIAGVYEQIDISYIFERHPILNSFYKTLAIADEIFGDKFPANTYDFDVFLATLPENVKDKIFGDAKALSSLIDFYLSSLLVNSGCIEVDGKEGLDYYINTFPKEFVEQRIKDQYPDNALIQSIRLVTVEKPDGSTRLELKINTTGMDNVDKERLSSAWADLYNSNPEYAIKLFKYNFFKGGIGYTPKTFMHLLPILMKRSIPNYLSTFSKLPTLNAEVIVDQYMRNHWNDRKYVPRFNKKEVEIKDDKVFLTGNNARLANKLEYITVRISKGVEKLYKRDGVNDSGDIYYKEISPLGNNGEYLEISPASIEESLDSTTSIIEEIPSQIPSYSNEDVNSNSDSIIELTSEEEGYYDEVLAKTLSERALKWFRALPESEKQQQKTFRKDWFKDKFAELGIPFDMENFDKLYDKFCN